jgi:hypothetical protein
MTIDNKNINNGLLPLIWGPHLWKSLHCITFAYPINPTQEDKINYKNFFIYLQYVIPCKSCGDSYAKFINEGDVKLTDSVLENRATLTKWMYDLHNAVNNKLSINYDVSFKQIKDRYEKFRAICDPNLPGCIMSLNNKKESYIHNSINDCSVIPLEIAKQFDVYAKKMGIDNFIEEIIYYHNIYLDKDNNIDKWEKRNNDCYNIITHMNNNAIKSFDENDVPSKEELLLLSKLCSKVNVNTLKKILNKQKGGSIIYKFINL